jgi:hypothetical protein
VGKLINKYLPKIMNIVLIAALLYGCYYAWGLYSVYNEGWKQGSRDGKAFYHEALEQKWRSISFNREKAHWVDLHMPKKNGKTWKDQLYRQGWEGAVDKETENIPK